MENLVVFLTPQDASLASDLLSRLQRSAAISIETAADGLNTSALHDLAARIYASRRDRRHFFEEGLFSDPAWDMLVALYCAWACGKRLSVTSLVYSADVPPTTGLRWVKNLEEAGLVEKFRDESDGRRIYVSLTPDAQERIERYLKRAVELHFSSNARRLEPSGA